MSRFVVGYSQDKKHLTLTIKIENGVTLAATDGGVAPSIKALMPLNDCIVKFDQDRKLIVLKSLVSDFDLVFHNCEEILEKNEFSYIKDAILRNCEAHGAIDLAARRRATARPTRSNARTNMRFLAKVVAFALAPTIAISGFQIYQSNAKSTKDYSFPEAYYETYTNNRTRPSTTTTEQYQVDYMGSNQRVIRDPEYYGEKTTMAPSIPVVSDIGTVISSGPFVSSVTEPSSTMAKVTTTAPMTTTVAPTNPTTTTTTTTTTSATTTTVPETTAPVEEPKQIEPTVVYLNFRDLSDTEKAQKAKDNYFDIIKKYAYKYGLDPELILSIATQERGVHSSSIDKGGAIGLMQIQYNVWKNETIVYYEQNEETGAFEKKKMTITRDKLEDVDTNIQIGCLIFQECLRNSKYNIPIAIQMYNMGIGTMNRIIDRYAYSNGIKRADVYNNMSDIGWTKYRSGYSGDPKYLEHVNEWTFDNTYVVYDLDNNPISVQFTNENEEQLHK